MTLIAHLNEPAAGNALEMGTEAASRRRADSSNLQRLMNEGIANDFLVTSDGLVPRYLRRGNKDHSDETKGAAQVEVVICLPHAPVVAIDNSPTLDELQLHRRAQGTQLPRWLTSAALPIIAALTAR